MISSSGRFRQDKFADVFQTDESRMIEYIVVRRENTSSGRPITITQKDVRAIQLAKGALSAGIRLLCSESGFKAPRQILLAGAFGSYIRAEDALAIGMFTDIAPSGLLTVGNAAGAGAILALFDDDCRTRAISLIRSTRVLDLARHPEFQSIFLAELAFP